MNRMTLTFICVALVASVLGATADTISGSMQRWLIFPAWKLLSGNARAAECARVNDVCIYYETYGGGPPVLVLHGGLGSIESMSYQIRALAKCNFVIAADSRGHGLSTDTDAPLSYAMMSDDMLKLLNHLQIDKVDVIGWSDGAIIGLDLAIRHPERIRRLIALSANYDVNGLIERPVLGAAPHMPLRYRLLAPEPIHWPALYRKVVMMQQKQPRYSKEDLHKIEAKTLIMAGEFDIIKREHTNALAAAISDSQEIIVQGASHSLLSEKPGIVNSHILQFLDHRGCGS